MLIPIYVPQILEHFGSNDEDAASTTKKVTNTLKGLRERRNSRKHAPPIKVRSAVPSLQPSPRAESSGDEDEGTGEEKDGMDSARGEEKS